VAIEGVRGTAGPSGTDRTLDCQRRDRLARDRRTPVDLRTGVDGDDVDDPPAVDRAPELARVQPVGTLPLQVSTQREFEPELVHTGTVRSATKSPRFIRSVVRASVTERRTQCLSGRDPEKR